MSGWTLVTMKSPYIQTPQSGGKRDRENPVVVDCTLRSSSILDAGEDDKCARNLSPGSAHDRRGSARAREGLHPGLLLCHPYGVQGINTTLLNPVRGDKMVAPDGVFGIRGDGWVMERNDACLEALWSGS